MAVWALAALLAFVFLAGGGALAAGPEDELAAVREDLVAMTKSSRGGSREAWLDLETRLLRVLDKSKSVETDVMALRTLGLTRESLGRRSGAQADFRMAAEYYLRVAERAPRHPTADDRLLDAARLRQTRLDDPRGAADCLLRLLDGRASPDARRRAEAMLASLPAEARRAAQEQAAQEQAAQEQAAQEQGVRKQAGRSAPVPAARDKAKAPPTVAEKKAAAKRSVKVAAKAPEKPTAKPAGKAPAATTVKAASKTPGRTAGNEARNEVGNKAGDGTGTAAGKMTGKGARGAAPSIAARPAAKGGLVADGGGKKAAKMSRADKAKVSDNLFEQLGLSIRTIMVDAGHGGKDPGAMAFGIKEKDVNLRVAKLLGAELRRKGYRVLYVRARDVFVPLAKRTAMANQAKADLFVSIHCNAHRDGSVSGMETYSLNLAKSQDAARVAARENAQAGKKIGDLQVILTELMLGSKIKESADLAACVQRCAVSAARERFPMKDGGVKEAPFYVLMGARMPSILAEIGFLTNREEARRLASEDGQRRIARGIAAGVEEYRLRLERFAAL